MLEEEKKQTKEEENIVIPRLLSAQEVGEILGISERAVNKLVSEGRLGYVRLTGSKKAFTLDLVGDFISAETVRRSQDGVADQVRRVSSGYTMNPYDHRDANDCGQRPRNYSHDWPGPRY